MSQDAINKINKEMYCKSNRVMTAFAQKLIKAFAGVFLFLPLTMISFGAVCYKENKWPWELN